MNELSIGEVARRAGLRPSALRYYERLGLLPSPKRVNGRRHYTQDIMRELTFIQFARRVGFTLPEIKELARQRGSLMSPSANWRNAMDEKLVQLNARIEQIQFMMEILVRARECHCRRPEDCVILDRSWWSQAEPPI